MFNENKYDYLIVGAGLFGAVCAYRLKQMNKKVLVIDKRNHIGGNIFTEKKGCGIHVHKYGAHIFHTNNKEVWDFITQFANFQQYQNEPIANYNNEYFNLPFNMHTFYQVYGIKTIDELEKYMEKWNKTIEEPKNVEEVAIKYVGKKLYKKLIKGYTEKQWGCKCSDLPTDILKRIPIRKEWNNNYFNDKYQGIPENGYTEIVEKLLDGVDVVLNEAFSIEKHYDLAEKIIYCGSIDSLLLYDLGVLDFRSLRFVEVDGEPSTGVPVMNFTSSKVPYTRIINHKMFLKETKNINTTILTYEYPEKFTLFNERYYPINDDINNKLYLDYVNLLKNTYPKIIPGGRLGLYKYLDMDKTIENALNMEL